MLTTRLQTIWLTASPEEQLAAKAEARVILANLIHYRSSGTYYTDDVEQLAAELISFRVQNAKSRHNCSPNGKWSNCCICDGRIHLEGCTTKARAIDCSPERHKMLFQLGHVRGLGDTSFLMWSPEHPSGVHQALFSPEERRVYDAAD